MPEPKLTPFTTVFRADETHRIRRNRSAVSCTACQRRKSKCDRQQPCSACVKRNDVASCHFEKTPTSGSGNKKELQARLSKLEQMVKGFASDAPTNPAQSSHSGSYGISEEGDDHRSSDHTVLKGLNTADGVESSYHGATSWAALMSGIRDIQTLLAADGSYDAEDEYVEEYSEDPDLLLGGIPSITIEEVIHSLPSRQDADRLITAYFNARFVALPYIHAHQFRRRYEAFWQNPQSLDFLWISILFSVFAFGSSVVQTSSPTTLPTVASAKFYLSKSAQCLIAGHYLRAKPYAVEAVIIHAHCRNVHKVDSDSTLWSIYGIAVRLAQKRGYHRDPRAIALQLSPFEAEMRRRVWFVIQSSDVLFSFQHGMPSIIDDGLCDTLPPSNLTDEDFDEDSLALPAPRPPTDPIPILAYANKATLARIMRRVVRNALCVETQPYSQVVTLQKDHEKWYAALPPCLKIRTIAETSFTDQNYTIMHRLMLEMMYLKSLCVLHRPYLSKHKTDPKYDSSRQICRDSAVKILNHHVEFDLAMRPGGRMYDDRHMVASLTYHHFLMAAMVLCIDLSETSDYSFEDRSSRIQLLHSIHSIWAARASESRDAKYASQVLRAVLNNVDTPSTTTSSGATPSTSTETSSAAISDANPDFTLPIYDPSFSAMSMNFDDFPRIDTLFGNGTESVDWRSLDQYLRMNHSLIDLDTWDA
ncbi:fungal specific transcription factor domain-containing protein [Pochonia chlamydosporia 170]|uniref:Fungal specific transcription factor domain-containing protein n=1 Tax=Pochonia chlamydosporia 170 TaxID=1380566 RepID=A0A179F974_METCM|nr:fungal specific transcription factor domain-containing protein [Pochonia chlamydosporia 170]OAQ61988.1 fungal specific transcription factor domain-containing protein [Pochonia chlamydosporia 170]